MTKCQGIVITSYLHFLKDTKYDLINVGNNFLDINPQKYIVEVVFNFLSELNFDYADFSDHSHKKRKEFPKSLSVSCDNVQI